LNVRDINDLGQMCVQTSH